MTGQQKRMNKRIRVIYSVVLFVLLMKLSTSYYPQFFDFEHRGYIVHMLCTVIFLMFGMFAYSNNYWLPIQTDEEIEADRQFYNKYPFKRNDLVRLRHSNTPMVFQFFNGFSEAVCRNVNYNGYITFNPEDLELIEKGNK